MFFKDEFKMSFNKLNLVEKDVILHKGTEEPFTGKYNDNKEEGLYVCKQCNAPLYYSDYKFDSKCGWPSFDEEIVGAIKRVVNDGDPRLEIVCKSCGGHLGHVFHNEGYTEKNIRHCVNSVSIKFLSNKDLETFETAVFASGCFWGTQYFFQKAKGVIFTKVGFMGGHKDNPTYEEVCTGKTNHAEVVFVKFDSSQISYAKLVELFFETHNFSQEDGQGPDLGTQYRSVIFYNNDSQKEIAEQYKTILQEKGLHVATSIEKESTFWEAENYHHNHYQDNGQSPYCHAFRKIF